MNWWLVISFVGFAIFVDIQVINKNPIQQIDGYLTNSEYQTLEADDRLVNSKAAGGAYHTFTARTRNICELEFLQSHDSLDRDSIDYCKKNPEGYSPEHWKYSF